MSSQFGGLVFIASLSQLTMIFHDITWNSPWHDLNHQSHVRNLSIRVLPRKLMWKLNIFPFEKEKSSSKPPNLGSMLVFGSVIQPSKFLWSWSVSVQNVLPLSKWPPPKRSRIPYSPPKSRKWGGVTLHKTMVGIRSFPGAFAVSLREDY